MSWIFDSHIHLSDPEYQSDMSYIIKSMQKLNINSCCVSMDFETSQKTLEISKISDLILPFIGVHPEMAQNNVSKTFELIEKNHKENCKALFSIQCWTTSCHLACLVKMKKLWAINFT